MIAVSTRRIILGIALAAAAGGLASACGVKGPLYLPEETETDEEKDADKEKTSRSTPALLPARHG